MNNNLIIERFYASFFEKCPSYERKPRIMDNHILGKNECYDSKKVNMPDFKCNIIDRDIIFEVSNLIDLVSEDSKLKLKPRTTFCIPDFTKHPINKINEKMQENFNNINSDFKNPIILLLNVDLSDVDPLQIALVLKEKIDFIVKKELLSAIIICKKSFSTGFLFINKYSKNKLSDGELHMIINIFSKNNFNFTSQLTEPGYLMGIDNIMN